MFFGFLYLIAYMRMRASPISIFMKTMCSILSGTSWHVLLSECNCVVNKRKCIVKLKNHQAPSQNVLKPRFVADGKVQESRKSMLPVEF